MPADGAFSDVFPAVVWHGLSYWPICTIYTSVRNAGGPALAGLKCRALPDGITVRVNSLTAYEPDALVHCGDLPALNALEVPNPIIVVEMLSPSSMRRDLTGNVAGYFKVESICHYLIVDAEGAVIIHYGRSADGIHPPKIIHEGEITLDPPGLVLNAADLPCLPERCRLPPP